MTQGAILSAGTTTAHLLQPLILTPQTTWRGTWGLVPRLRMDGAVFSASWATMPRARLDADGTRSVPPMRLACMMARRGDQHAPDTVFLLSCRCSVLRNAGLKGWARSTVQVPCSRMARALVSKDSMGAGELRGTHVYPTAAKPVISSLTVMGFQHQPSHRIPCTKART